MKKNVYQALVAKKKFSKFSLTLLAGLLLTFAFPLQGWAGGSTDYYARLKTQVSGNSTGMGMVYANTSNDDSKGTYSTSSTSANLTTTTKGGNLSFYAFAKPNTGYMFEGWSSSNNSTTIASTDNPYTVQVSASAESSSSPSEKTVYAVFKEIPMATITYKAPINGSYSYSYSGEVVTMNPGDADKQKQTKDAATLTATPNDGYDFLRWKMTTSDGVSYFGGNPAENVSFDKDATVEAEFVPDTWALFIIRDGDGAQYTDLNEANTAALASSSKTIVVAKDGELIAGNYTISSAVTLVVPFESTGSKGITKPVVLSNSTLPISLYRKLTLLPGANISLQGKLAVAAQVQSGDASHNPCGFPVGPVGCLDMSKGGHIEVENGGTIYCWGFIKGQDYLDGNNTQNVGTITAKNGSTIKECYGTADWGGGSYAYAVGQNSKSYRIYPFQGYFVQNIEVPLRMEYGAKDYLYCNVYASSSQNEVNDIPFIGNTSGVLFRINGADGAVTKWYDPTTDHLVVELEGNASLDNLQMSIYITINANDFDLPILSNMHLKLKDCQLTLSAPMKLQPGAILEIPAGSSLTLKSKLYVYDHDQWGVYVQKKYFKTLPAILTQFRSRGDGSTNTLDDAQIICDGAIIMANGGGLYTTASGANVMGHNGGTIQWESSLPANSTTYGYTNGNGVTGSNFTSKLTPEFCDGAECTPAKAHNDNDSYTAAKAGTTFTNVYGRWFGGDAKNEKANHTYDFTYINADANVTTEAIYWLDAAGEGHWNNATTTDVTYLNTWKGTEEKTGITAYYAYIVYDQDNNPHDGWIKLTQVGTSENFGGSDNNMYVYVNDKWQSIGSTDSECLYTIGGVRQALVGGTLVPITKNTTPEDGAWHATATPTNYYVDLSSGACIWTPATKVAGVEKAYVIEGTTYLRYDMTGMGEDWMAVQYQSPFYYTVDEQNLRTYYEYNANTGAWQVAVPKITVTDEKGVPQSFFFLSDAIATANSTYNPTITLLADLAENPTSELVINTTVKSLTYTINLNGHTATLTRSVSGTSTAGVGNRFLNITSNMAVKIIDLSAEQNGQIRCLATGNAYARGITVTDGTLTLESGKLYVQNDAPYTSNTSERVYGVVVAAGKTFTMNGGEIEAASEYYGWCIVGSGSATTRSVINMNGGVLNANAYYNAEGIYSTADVNMAGGTINAKTCPMFSKTSGNQYAYGIYVNASANATEANAYHGKLTMTGGTINAYAVSNYAYGVYVHSASATMSTSKANISSAEAVINGGTINAESKTTTVYGVYIYGGPNSYSKMDDVKTVINNATVNATGTNTVYGIFIHAGVADLNGGLLYGIAEINDCNVTATSTSSTNAYGVFVNAATRMMNETTYSMISESNKKTWCFKENGKVIIPSTDGKNTYTYQTGYYGCGGKATINGGTFTAITKTYNAYGAYCTGSCVSGAEESTQIQKEGRGTLTIHGGTFNAKSTTYNSYGICNYGVTTIDGGTFNATPTTYGAYGAVGSRGTLDINGGTFNVTAATKNAYGVVANGWVDTSRGIHAHGVVTVSNGVFNVTTKSAENAYGAWANVTSAELTAAKYAARSESDRNYYFTHETNALKANYYLYRIGKYYEGGELIVNGGTFNVASKTSAAYAINVVSDNYTGTEIIYPKATINGGLFKVTSGTANKSYAVNTATDKENCVIKGGHYNVTSGLTSSTATKNYVNTPYHVLTCMDDDLKSTYPYEVAEGYKITFKNGSTVLQDGYVKAGETPSYTGATPTKAEDAQYTYTFNGWTPAIATVSADATYTATYTETKKSYTLTWNLDGGNVKTPGTPTGSVEWGTPLTAPVVEKTGYTFDGWTPEVPATMPTENATYTAQWTAQQEVTYTVNHYYESALGVKESKPFQTEEKQGMVGDQVSAEDVLELDGYDSPAPSTQTIAADGSTVVDYYYRSRNLNVTSEVVIAGADLDQIVVENNGTLSASVPSTVKRLVLTATPGNNDGANADLTNISISESVCIEIEMNSTGKMNDKLYYCFSVPFAVNVADGVERLHKDNDTWSKAVLNTNYRVYTYNEADRAKKGPQDSNWTPFKGNHFLPGVFYLCEFDNSNFNRYRFYAADKNNLNNKSNIAVSNTGDATNGGWNGVANNGLTDNQLSGDFTYIQTLNSESNSFESATASETPMAIGNAAMVQVSASGSVVVGETSSAVAARRMGETASTEFINVRLFKENQDKHVDQIFIRASEDASEQYVAGIDLSKATMGTPKVARIWVNDYNLQLVANEAIMANNQAVFSLGMSAPANGEYIIALENTPDNAIVYLTENGSAIWNLNIAPAPISLNKGTENNYGLRLVRKINNVVTGFDEALLNDDVQKVIMNDHLYIIRDGKVYSAHGHAIK